MNQNKKYTDIMKQLNYKPIGSVLLRLCGVVKPFYCLDEVHRGKKDRCKQQCEYCTGFS